MELYPIAFSKVDILLSGENLTDVLMYLVKRVIKSFLGTLKPLHPVCSGGAIPPHHLTARVAAAGSLGEPSYSNPTSTPHTCI